MLTFYHDDGTLVTAVTVEDLGQNVDRSADIYAFVLEQVISAVEQTKTRLC
jgi:hypothetical protein